MISKGIKGLLIYIILVSVSSLMATAQQARIDWATYYSGANTTISKIVYDSIGKGIYIVGTTVDTFNISTPGAVKPAFTGHMIIPGSTAPRTLINSHTDGFIARFDLDGNKLWGTYVGGIKSEFITQATVDHLGHLYIVGYTTSTEGIATEGAHLDEVSYDDPDTMYSGFISKYSPTGAQLWSTYYGHATNDRTALYDIDIDATGYVYVSGLTLSEGIATPDAYMTSIGSSEYLNILAKFSPDGEQVWSTYNDRGGDNIKVINDHIYILGHSEQLGSTGVYQPSPLSLHGYVLTRFDTSGQYQWMTHVTIPAEADNPFPQNDHLGLDVDEDENIYILGKTNSTTHIATEGAHQPTLFTSGLDCYGTFYEPVRCFDYYITKFDSSGQKIWGTYYGAEENPRLDNTRISNVYRGKIQYHDQSIYVGLGLYDMYMGTNVDVDVTESLLTTECTYTPISGKERGLIARFDTNNNLLWGTLYDESINAIALVPSDAAGNPSIPGVTKIESDIYFSADANLDGLSTPGSYQETKMSTSYSGLLAKFIQVCPDSLLLITRSDYTLSAVVGYSQYEWYHNDELVFTSTSNEFITTDTTGTFYCKATLCQCTYISNILEPAPTSIDNIDQETLWNIYPNPAHDKLYIKKQLNTENETYVIINNLGQKIKEGRLNEEITAIDISEYNDGMFFLLLQNSNNQKVNYKFIKTSN